MARHGLSAPQRGLTLIELLTVVVIVAVVATMLLERLLPLLGEAERMHIRMNHDALATAVNLENARRALQDKPEAMAALAGSNPMALVDRPPDNYIGAFGDPDPAAIDGGHWYFDREQDVLVYRVRHARYFHSELAGPPRVRFRIETEAAAAAASGGLRAARLRLLDAYDWQSLDSELQHWLTRTLE